jgi:transposase
MQYVGIDYHKRYSVLCATDERGQELKRRRINGNTVAGFAQFFSELGEESKVVMEACWNWGWLYDLLGKIDGIDQVVLAHPYKTRLIAEAQIKTDKIDAQMLAKLLRGDLIAQSHAPSAATRARKHLLRQRLFWVRLRTMLRNRMHAVLDRQHDLERPQLKNFFSRRGQSWLQNVQLPCPEDQPLLEQDLEVAELLEQKIKQLDRLIGQTQSQEEKLLESIPGIGPLFSSVIATEIDGIARDSTRRPNWPLTPEWYPLPTPAAGECLTVAYCGNATNGCAGRSLKRAGARSSSAATLARSTDALAREAKTKTSP